LARERPDAVISDNRYGLYNREIISVFITHQLCIYTGLGKLADRWLQGINYRYIERFSFCWVPDLEEKQGLAGFLSHPGRLPAIPIRYIGLLSRFERRSNADPGSELVPAPGLAHGREPTSCDLLILLSGPEPQRTIFECRVLEQLEGYTGKLILVRGLPGDTAGNKIQWGEPGAWEAGTPVVPPGALVYDHLPAAALNKVVEGAEWVLCRPGYSSVMDLLKLGKKCIFVPTPGQTEQEYLGSYLAGRGLAYCVPQHGFSLNAALEAAKDFPFGGIGQSDNERFRKEIEFLVGAIQSKSGGSGR
jgi:hypothetical protein